MQLKQYIRYGTAYDKEFLQDYIDKYEGIVLSANSLCFQSEYISRLINVELKEKPFFIDPRVNFFQTDLEKIKKDGKFKKSYILLANEYNIDFTIEKDSPLKISDITKIGLSNFAYSILSFQEKFISKILPEHLKLFSKFTNQYKTPDFLIAPAFHIETKKDLDWIKLNKDLLDESLNLKNEFNNLRIYANLLINKDILLEDDMINKIIEQYSNADGIVFWIDNFNELTIDTKYIIAFKQFIQKCNSKYPKKELISLYGGYFTQLLSHLGISGVTHSLEYGEYKSIKGQGGMPMHKFYLPELKFRMKPFDMIKLLKDMNINSKEKFYKKICSCNICKKNIDSDNIHSNFFIYLDDSNKKKLQRSISKANCIDHYLEVKYIEFEHIKNNNFQYLIEELNIIYNKFISNKYFDSTKLLYLDKWYKSLKD
jgi:hypothetical protein